MEKLTKENENLIGKLLFIVALYILFAKPLWDKFQIMLGNKDSPIKKEIEEEALNVVNVKPIKASPFGKDYWRQFYADANSPLNGRERLRGDLYDPAKSKAAQLKKCFGFFSDDDTNFITVFGTIKSKAELSLVCWFLESDLKKPALTFFRTGLDTLPNNGMGETTIKKIISASKKLPNK